MHQQIIIIHCTSKANITKEFSKVKHYPKMFPKHFNGIVPTPTNRTKLKYAPNTEVEKTRTLSTYLRDQVKQQKVLQQRKLLSKLI